MQLTELLTAAGRARWLLVVLPVLCAALWVGVHADDSPRATSLATVAVVVPETDTSASAVAQAVEAFRSALVSETAVQDAGDAVGVELVVDRDVTAERVGTSNLLDVEVRTPPGTDVAAVVEALVRSTAQELYVAPVGIAQARLDRADARYTDALERREGLTERSGLLLPIEAYRAKESEATQLRVALTTGLANGTVAGAGAAALQEALDRAETDLARIGTAVDRYEPVQDEVERSRALRADARAELDAVLVRQDAAVQPETLDVGAPVTESRRTLLVRAGVTGAVGGLALAAAVVLAAGLLRDRPRTHRSGPDPAPARGAPGPASTPRRETRRARRRRSASTPPATPTATGADTPDQDPEHDGPRTPTPVGRR